MRVLKLLTLIFLASISHTAPAEHLVILHTNDTHSQIDPDADGLGGIQRRKVVIDSIRDANENVLLIDVGDIVQGTLFFNLYKGELEEILMNLLGYDIRILGNHEFDNGMQMLADNLSIANADLLCSNYQLRKTPLAGIFKPYNIREIAGKRIAFMPINLNPVGMIIGRNVEGMGYVDALETANHMAWYLKNIEEADMVVALTHIGYSDGEPSDIDLVQQSNDIDLIIGGHSHTYINPDDPESSPWIYDNAEGRPIHIAQTGRGGANIGEIVIDLDDISNITQRLIPIDSRLDDRLDPSIEAAIQPYRSALDSLRNVVVAQTASYLDRKKDPLLNYLSDYVVTRGRQLADSVDFSIFNKGGIRNSLPKGNVSEEQILTMVPFCNHVQVIDLSGKSLLEAFDVMAKADGNGVSSEIAATYDPDADRCIEVTLNGQPLDPERTYRIATIDYLSQGGDYMASLRDHQLVAESDKCLYDDLLDYLKSGKAVVIDPDPKPRMVKATIHQ